MIDPHDRECLINHNWLNTTQVIILLGFTETTPGKHPNRIEIHIKMQIYALSLRELPGLPCIFFHFNIIGNVLFNIIHDQ
jgi:hypothetical protein